MRDHLLSVWKQNGEMPRRLADSPELPAVLDPLWNDFLELHTSRGSNGFGPARIGFVDIDAWQRVGKVTLRPWQIDAIRRADAAYFAAMPKPKGRGQ